MRWLLLKAGHFRLQGSLLVALTVAFWLPTSPAHAVEKKTLKIAFRAAETGFDPAQISDWYSIIVNDQIFDTALHYDYLARPVKFKPNLVEAIPEISAAGPVYQLRFRKGTFLSCYPAFGG